ncbi:recombinase family protein [Neorhodopirellula lusitana]|uniref:recombinase family protein n=1 Tax=Neorhodopirellula lusitana TaxID=445327 RepID=UPI00384AC6F3
MRVVCYYRFSTDNRLQLDNSEQRQQESVKKLCNRNGWLIVEEVVDKATSGDGEKPSLNRLRDAYKSGEIEFDAIVADSLSRITRRGLFDMHLDVGWMRDAGIKLAVVDMGGVPFLVDELGRDIAKSVDVWKNNAENIERGSKVSDGMRTKFMRGKLGWCGQVPLGYDLVRSVDGPSYLVANDDLKHVREIFQFYLGGGAIRGAVEILLKTQRFREKQAGSDEVKDPNSTSVKNLLRNSIYCGKRTYGVRNVAKYGGVNEDNPKWTKDNPLAMTDLVIDYDPEGFEKAVSYADYLKVQQMLKKSKNRHGKRNTPVNSKYKGLLVCGNCGTPLFADPYKDKKTGKKLTSYTCKAADQRGPKCREEKPYRKSIRTDEFEDLLVKEFGLFFMKPDTHICNVQKVLDGLVLESMDSGERDTAADLDVQQQRLEQLTKQWQEGGMSPTLGEVIQQQAKRIDELRQKQKEDLDKPIETLLDVCRRQSDESWEAKGFGRYLGSCYRIAYGIHTGVYQWSSRESKLGLAQQLIKEFTEGLVLVKHPTTAELFEIESHEGLRHSFSNADRCVEALRAMLIEDIVVDFQLGLSRGRPSQVPTSLEFVFSVPTSDCTDMGWLRR